MVISVEKQTNTIEDTDFQELLNDLGVISSLGDDKYLTVYGTIIMVKNVEE